MGDAGVKAPSDHASAQALAAFAAFPSPASITCSLDTPLLERAPPPLPVPPFSGQGPPRHATLDADNILPAEPDPFSLPQVLTPPANEVDEPSLNMIVGGALAPTSSVRRPRSASRPKAGLRLPSFEMLGIAAPHPDRFGLLSLDGHSAGGVGEITPESLNLTETAPDLAERLATLELETPAVPTGLSPSTEKVFSRPVHSPPFQYGDPLTPPEDIPFIDWNNASFSTKTMISADGQPEGSSLQGEEGQGGADDAGRGPGGDGITGQSRNTPDLVWFSGAVQALVDNLRSAPRSNNSLRILSHALPSPSLTGHLFNDIISAIQEETAAVESWINVFHAIPGRFNLADLPRSPPSTPGPAVGGSDYFTEKVFDSAVSIADYQDDLSHLPRSPRTVVPPGSVDISIVERYIPPTSSNEYKQMFEINVGQSILIDRLKELSPNNGSLLFIYPTKAGGLTFMREYLSPVLDPVLRSMGVVHGLSTSLASTLGGMPAVERLPTYASCRAQMDALLTRIAQGGPTVERLFEQRQQPRLSLAYAARQLVHLDRDVWARSWWTKQEKPRIREAVTRYAREAQTRSSNAHVERPLTSTELVQELLKGVEGKPYPPGQEPEHRIEVAVFVVRRFA